MPGISSGARPLVVKYRPSKRALGKAAEALGAAQPGSGAQQGSEGGGRSGASPLEEGGRSRSRMKGSSENLTEEVGRA